MPTIGIGPINLNNGTEQTTQKNIHSYIDFSTGKRQHGNAKTVKHPVIRLGFNPTMDTHQTHTGSSELS